MLPPDCGVLVTDSFGAAVHRMAVAAAMSPPRRRRQMHRFALAAAARLRGFTDPAGERVREGL